jgi:hypothetical protein
VPKRPATPPELDAATHRRLAVGLYNFTWTLMEKPDRTADETDLMIHGAHASRYHWEKVAAAVNRARGEWLCARVYSVLGRAEPALWHARRCLAIVEAGGDGFEDWDRASALEAVARAYAVAGNRVESDRYRAIAAAELPKIAEADDREVIEKDLASIPA